MSGSNYIATLLGRGLVNGAPAEGLVDRSGAQVVMDFYTKAIKDGKGYQLRAGTITAPVVGDVLITDTKAEMAVDAEAGVCIIPTYANVALQLAAATLYEVGIKSQAAISTSGTAFVPLPLLKNGVAWGGVARVAAAGGVVVANELVTDTALHYSWAQPIAAGAYTTTFEWQPTAPPWWNGAACGYLQIGGDTTGPSYFSNLDFLSMTSSSLGI